MAGAFRDFFGSGWPFGSASAILLVLAGRGPVEAGGSLRRRPIEGKKSVGKQSGTSRKTLFVYLAFSEGTKTNIVIP